MTHSPGLMELRTPTVLGPLVSHFISNPVLPSTAMVSLSRPSAATPCRLSAKRSFHQAQVSFYLQSQQSILYEQVSTIYQWTQSDKIKTGRILWWSLTTVLVIFDWQLITIASVWLDISLKSVGVFSVRILARQVNFYRITKYNTTTSNQLYFPNE
jgi:hypothetical protein